MFRRSASVFSFSTASSSSLFLRPTRSLCIIYNPELLKTQMKKNRSGYGDIDPDRLRQFEEMQTGMSRTLIERKKKEREDFLALPTEVQIRKFMCQQRKFDVDLVRKNGMNVAEEFELYKATIRSNDKKANRSFWIPIILSGLMIWGGTSYWVFGWY